MTSATIAPERFSEHFDGAPIINVEGRTYPVDVRYRPFDVESPDEQDLQQERAILSAVDELFQQGPGDTLIFLPGERDIRNTTELLRKHHPRHVDILPLYARLSADEQMRVVWVPGACEITIVAKKLAASGKYALINESGPHLKLEM